MQGSQRGCTGQRVATKAAAMNATGNMSTLHHARPQADRAHRYSTGNGLCQAENIRLQIIEIASKETSCAPKACLHLINNEQSSTFATERCKTSYIFLCSYMDTSLSLHQFNDYRCRLLIDRGLCRREVVVTNMANARNKWCKRLAIMGLPSCRKRAHCATMEATECSNYSGAPCSDSRKFESAFHSLGAAVTQKDMGEPWRCEMG